MYLNDDSVGLKILSENQLNRSSFTYFGSVKTFLFKSRNYKLNLDVKSS